MPVRILIVETVPSVVRVTRRRARVVMAIRVPTAVAGTSVRVVMVMRVRIAVGPVRVVRVAMGIRVPTAVVAETAVRVARETPVRTTATARSVRAATGMHVRIVRARRAQTAARPVTAGPGPGLRDASTARTPAPRVLPRISASAGRSFPKR